jgi:hypothetical protein
MIPIYGLLFAAVDGVYGRWVTRASWESPDGRPPSSCYR